MPVHRAFERGTIAEKDLDHYVDPKGCLQSGRSIHRLEPVCCCERCYACLANPLVDKLLEPGWHTENVFLTEEDDVLLAQDWFSLYPCASCECPRCVDDCRTLCGNDGAGRSDMIVISSDSPSLNKKRMSTDSPVADNFSCPKYHVGRRPLVDLQWGVLSDEDDTMKQPATYYTKRSSWSHDAYTQSCDETRSWVQPPPNRTICHIIDDVTLERLTASSPVLTRCCLASHKHASGRQVGKAKAKNHVISR